MKSTHYNGNRCLTCDAEIYHIGPSYFGKRKYCCWACDKADKAKRAAARNAEESTHYNGDKCLNCDKALFHAYPALFGKKKYCSKPCLRAHRLKKLIPCETCGKQFVKHQKTTRFCSHACRGKGNCKLDRSCPKCGVSFRRGTGNAQNRYCVTCAPTTIDRYRLTKYGVSFPEWSAMMTEQEGKCFLCKDQPATDMDHDHLTGKPRRPLCERCNTNLGGFESFDLEVVLGYIDSFR